jgi:uncharacterized membrane protein (DUF4010 family)
VYEVRYETNVPNFFSGNIIAITMTFTWIIYTPFSINRLFFMITFFPFLLIYKMGSIEFTLHRAQQVAVEGCQIWAVSRLGRKVHPIFATASRVRKLV